MNRFQENKIVECLAYLSTKVDLTDVKAYKLLWLADRMHLGLYARTITGDEYYALERGPVPSGVKKIVNHRIQSDIFDSNFKVEGKTLKRISSLSQYEYLSETDIDVLNQIIEAYGNYSERELTELSHKSPEWKRCESKFDAKKKSFKMEMDDFFIDFEDPKLLFVRNGEPEIARSVYYCE